MKGMLLLTARSKRTVNSNEYRKAVGMKESMTMAELPETVRLFDEKPYDTEFDAVILAVRPGKRPQTAEVVLDRTLFFPEEGGQTPDSGRLAGFPVADVQIDNCQVITHVLELASVGARDDSRENPVLLSAPDAAAGIDSENSAGGAEWQEADGRACMLPEGISPGQTVHGMIDWPHRYSNMQNHSGEHILSGLLHTIYGYDNVGFRLSDHTVTLDTSGHLTPEQLADLETKANEVVWRNVPITCEYPPPEVLKRLDYRSKKELDGAVRIVTIEGVDVCACCAPHVRRTGEVGLIKILSAIHSRGGSTRITLVCGQRALLQIQRQQAQLEKASRLMNEPQDTVAEGIERLQSEIVQLRETCRAKEQQFVEARLSQIAAQAPPPGERGCRDCYVFEEDLSVLSQRAFMNRLCEMGWRYAGVFCGGGDSGWKYLIGSRSADARVPNQVLRERLQARGGGKPDMVQGTVIAPREAVSEQLNHLP